MSDFDRRLTVELTAAYITSWNSNPQNKPIVPTDISAIISQIAAAVDALPHS